MPRSTGELCNLFRLLSARTHDQHHLCTRTLPPEWSWVTTDNVTEGADNTVVATKGVIRINEARYTWGDKPFCIELQVTELPDSAQIVFGSPTAGRKSHRWVPDYPKLRVYIRQFKETVRLDWLKNVLKCLLQGGGEKTHFFRCS